MTFSPEDKVRILRDLTRGAEDVFAVRTDKAAGWSWRPVYAPLPDRHVMMHLGGTIEIGSYALIPFGNNKAPNVRWVAADFDGKKVHTDWERDVQRTVEFLLDTGAPLFVNLSRSALGAHVRVLFNEPVPAWMARRWFNAWLEEAGVLATPDEDLSDGEPQSFDRLIPPQDFLNPLPNDDGTRKPGNLVGSPLNGKLARANGGTLPLDPKKVAMGNFAPDGLHWEHAAAALDGRTWGLSELKRALEEAPGSPLTSAPETVAGGSYGSEGFRLPIVQGNHKQLDYVVKFCEFMRHMKDPRNQTYQLWLALATQLHRFGDDGHDAFHAFSRVDARYVASETEQKWRESFALSPVRCDTLVAWGYRCPYLRGPRCNGAKAPSYFADHLDAEIL